MNYEIQHQINSHACKELSSRKTIQVLTFVVRTLSTSLSCLFALWTNLVIHDVTDGVCIAMMILIGLLAISNIQLFLFSTNGSVYWGQLPVDLRYFLTACTKNWTKMLLSLLFDSLDVTITIHYSDTVSVAISFFQPNSSWYSRYSLPM